MSRTVKRVGSRGGHLSTLVSLCGVGLLLSPQSSHSVKGWNDSITHCLIKTLHQQLKARHLDN